MVSVTCEQCGASVAGDEQFCPSCGNFIDPLATQHAPAPRPARSKARGGNVISISSDGGEYEEFSLEQSPVEARPRSAQAGGGGNGESSTCPSCGASNPPGNRHCQKCGARLNQGPLPKAPRPAVQATAGVRAAFAIAALLFGVIIIALLFNFLGNGETTATTTTLGTTTTSAQAENQPIPILRHDCDPPGLGSFVCENLSAGPASEFQVNWEELEANEETLTIRLHFAQAMTVNRIEWTNISDDDRFLQNHRARGISVQADRAIAPLLWQLTDTPDTQTFDFAAVGAHYIDFEVVSTWRSQLVGGNVWPDLAIAEIVVWGRPTEGN